MLEFLLEHFSNFLRQKTVRQTVKKAIVDPVRVQYTLLADEIMVNPGMISFGTFNRLYTLAFTGEDQGWDMQRGQYP